MNVKLIGIEAKCFLAWNIIIRLMNYTKILCEHVTNQVEFRSGLNFFQALI